MIGERTLAKVGIESGIWTIPVLIPLPWNKGSYLAGELLNHEKRVQRWLNTVDNFGTRRGTSTMDKLHRKFIPTKVFLEECLGGIKYVVWESDLESFNKSSFKEGLDELDYYLSIASSSLWENKINKYVWMYPDEIEKWAWGRNLRPYNGPKIRIHEPVTAKI